MPHDVTGQVSYQVDFRATGIDSNANNDDAREQMERLAASQVWLLYTLHQNGSLDSMITAAKNGEPMSDYTWDRLINEVHGDMVGSRNHSRVFDSSGNVHDYVRGGLSVFIGGDEIGPLRLVAPGDMKEMIKDGNLDPEEAEALMVLRAVYLKTGSRELAETALQNYYRLNSEDQKYALDNLFSPNARMVGEWHKTDGDDNDIKHATIEYPQPLSPEQERKSANMRFLLCYMPPETAEQLGKSETGVLHLIDSPNIGTNLAGSFLTTEESNELERIGDLFENHGTQLHNLHGTDALNLYDIIGKYAEASFGFSSQYSGEPAGGPNATTFTMALGVDAATERQIVQLQQLVDASSLTAAQKEAVFTYFVSNGKDADTTGAGEPELDKALYAFMNDQVMDDDAKTWMGETFALAKVQSGDTQSAWDLRALSGSYTPPVGNPGAQTIEASSTLGDPMITPSADPNRNVSSMVFHMVRDDASQEVRDDASRFVKSSSWDPLPVPDDNSIPQAAQIQMSDDSLTTAQQQTVAQIYDIIDGASTIPANQKSSLFSYILTGGKEPPQSTEMDNLVNTLKADATVASTDATLIDNTLNGTPIYQPDNITGANVTDQVWAGFAENGEGFDNQTYTQVTVTEANARAALSNLGLPLLPEAETRLIDGMVNGTLDPTDAAFLTRNADSPSLQPGDRDVILSAVHKGDAPVPVANDVDKYFKDSAIDAAFGNLDFSATDLTSDEILKLKKAAKDGTMTPEQVGVLFVAASQKGLSSDDKMALLNACDYSHRIAKAQHGLQWESEVAADRDDNKDTVIGDPYEAAMSPESCAEAGASSDDTQDLGSLYFQVMTDRLQALDKTVRTYSETVQQKNKAISTMNNAIAAVPPQPAGDAETVPLDSITFLDDDDQPQNLLAYLKKENIKLPTADGSTSLNSTQLSSLRQTMSNRATSWGSDSTMAASNFQNAYGKYNTCLSQISSFLPRWYEMLTKAFTGR